MALEAGLPSDAPAPTEHGRQWIKIELDHPVNPPALALCVRADPPAAAPTLL